MIAMAILVFTPIFAVTSQGENSGSTSLSLEPKVIEVPSELDQVPVLVLVELKVYNVTSLKEFYIKFSYDMSILEYHGGKIDRSFYLKTGGWRGNEFEGILGGTFSGSGTMFTYAFRVIQTGSTKIDLVNTKLVDEKGSIIPHTVSGSTIKVLSFEEFVNGEYTKFKEKYDALSENFMEIRAKYEMLNVSYNELLLKHDTLKADYVELTENYKELNSTHYRLKSNYDSLTATYSSLLVSHEELMSAYNKIKSGYDALKDDYEAIKSKYNELKLKNDALTVELNTTKNLSYISIITTTVFITTTLYLVIRKHKMKPV
jgi:prefoldin subunit 5